MLYLDIEGSELRKILMILSIRIGGSSAEFLNVGNHSDLSDLMSYTLGDLLMLKDIGV